MAGRRRKVDIYTDAAIAALREHLAAWPRDALVVASAASPNGLIGSSGRIGQKHQIAALMDSLAPHYGDDFWFLSYHAMALSEDGQLRAARSKIEQSLAANPKNAHGAHGFAHVCYESGEVDAARSFLSSWLTTYPREGFFYGHLSWHLSLCEVHRDQAGLQAPSPGAGLASLSLVWRSNAGVSRSTDAWSLLKS
jgi:tetratricopeptide (TPR) repeat protein